MAGKTIWKGHIRFGEFDLPVKLHTAVKEERIQFHLLHARDRVRLKQQMVCAVERLSVPPEEQTRGFEAGEGKYILMDPEELEQIEPEESRIIEIREFVRSSQLDPLFLERVYYLEPDAPSKGYNSLAAALMETKMAGICTWTMRRRSYVGALMISRKVLRLTVLRYADEVIHAKSLGLGKIPLSEKELKIGSDLINQLTATFEPQKFQNEHQKKLQNLIDKKARGEKIAILRPRRLRPTPSGKLLQVLEASLKKAA
jgi:DNA end-binding protein Ku